MAEDDSPRISATSLSSELLRYLRGKRSQLAFSKALGFGSNVAYSWETGRRFPEVSVFFRAAELARVPVSRRVLLFLKEPPQSLHGARFSSPRTVQTIVKLLVAGTPKSSLAEKLGVDRTTLGRWVQGKTEPRMPEFLRLVALTTQRLLEFVEVFADPDTLNATRRAYQDLRIQQRLAYDRPWSHALLRALELDQYLGHPHSVSLLSKAIGLPALEIEHLLAELAEAEQIVWDGHHWKVQRVLTVDTRQDPGRNRQLKLHWAKAAGHRLEQANYPEEALFSFNLFAISEERFQKIRELHLEYYDRVRSIIDESESADRVVLMNLQLLPLERQVP